ncbi:Exocyst complex component 4 [Paragonimus heterotremus]|uniref:Exocyst complex component Sec8 n=1 Tax=Paragonimus heterotremus TaxID=100268 RepID=A0A8J4SWH2_9TREM|nr:Exocyst complex component 4 [Paragonimus heterotremus]
MTQSSYLMSFIRSLMEHSSKDVREKKKKQLEADFTETGAVLNTCLTEKFEDVTKVLNVYNFVSERVSGNLSAVNKIRQDLVDCKSLLSCNREELRRLWLELVEQRRCIELVDILDRLQSAPDALATLVGVRAWAEATELMLYTAELLKSEIAIVPALQSVKTDLAHKHKFIVDHLKKRLRSLLYDRPISLILKKHMKLNEVRKLVKPSQCHTVSKSQPTSPTMMSKQFISLPLSAWHTAAVSPPRADPNLRKDPQAVAQAMAANVSSHQACTDSPMQVSALSDSEWMTELVAVVHCLVRLGKLPQILASWSPQSHLSQIQHSIDSSHRTVFTGPLNPGQGLLAELHRFVVLKAVSAVEARALAQGDTGLLSNLASPQYLVMLLRLVFDALFLQVRSCLLAIRAMKAASTITNDSPSRDLDGLSADYVWSCVQHEVQTILSGHLNKRTSADGSVYSSNALGGGSDMSTSLDANRLDLNSLLGRKRTGPFSLAAAAAAASGTFGPVTTGQSGKTDGGTGWNASGNVGDTRVTGSGSLELFSFSNTSHFLSVSSYMREHKVFTDADTQNWRNDDLVPGTDYPLVCQPSVNNIVHIYKQVMEFVEAMENEMAVSESTSSSILPVKRASQLRIYLKNFIENTFLPEALSSLRLQLQRRLTTADSLNAIISQQVERELGLQRPILLSVLSVDQCLMEVKQMIISLPEYTDGCLKIGTNLLNEFIGAMWRIYRSLSEVDSSGTTVSSSDWAQDNDVSRFWKKFPVWQRMAAHEAYLMASNALLSSQKGNSNSLSPTSLGGTSVGINSLPCLDSGSLQSQTGNIAPATAVILGLYCEFDCGTGTTDSRFNTRLVIPFDNGGRGPADTLNGGDPNVEFTHLSGLLYEREATRLAAKETKQLLHMIKDELPDSSQSGQQQTNVRQLPTIRNIQLLKILGRMSESLCWLSHRVLNLDTWLKHLRRRAGQGTPTDSSTRPSITKQASVGLLIDTPFASCAKELARLSEACLLMTYLEVRIQAYNHFGGLPSDVTYWCPVDDVDVDKYVTDFLVYLEHVQDMLVHTFSRHKFRFIFDGLGDFISQLLLRLIPMIPRMNANGNRKMCRNVYRLQQALTSLTETHESDLIRVKQLYELFSMTPEVSSLISPPLAYIAHHLLFTT